MLISACGEKKSTATEEWENKQEAAAKEQTELPATTTAKETKASEAAAPAEKGVRFIAYNLKNYLTMRRYSDGKSSYTGKPEAEIEALLKVIVGGKPDILGICEIGSKEDLADFQKRLAAKGINLPHTHHVQGSDSVRSLAILSKYPVKANPKPADSDYTLSGKQFFISRGIMDATVKITGKDVRFLGVHFKSKRPISEADQEMMRRNEAELLRKHIDTILDENKEAYLLAYGDFNDTKRTKTVYTVKGRANSSKRLELLEFADSRGEVWTHHWGRENIYSRIDFCMTSLALTPFVKLDSCLLLDPEYWELGSDHRAMLMIIR